MRHGDLVADEPASADEDPRPVIAVKVGGLTLGLGVGGEWLIWDQTRTPVSARSHLLWLLPLLERPPDEVAPAIAAADAGAEAGTELVPALLRYALASASRRWPALALGWLEAGYPVAELVDALGELKDSPQQTQPIRHRALRLWLKVRTTSRSQIT